MKGNIFFIALILLIFQYVNIFGQNNSFTATASKTTVGVNEQFEVSFILNAEGRSFQPPSLKDFMVLSGPNQSSSMEFHNGVMSQSISYGFILQAKSEGTYKIPPATIESGGKQLKSNSLTITVSKSNSANQNNNTNEQSLDSQIAENLYIKAIVNKTNIYRGEGISVTYKLFSKIDLVNFNLSKMPTLDGFWSQDADGSKKLELIREVIEGQQYYTAEVKKSVLFPQREGTLTLDPMEAQTVVRVKTKRKARGNDPFEDFFNDPYFGGSYQEYNYLVKSNPVKIKVNPLPANAPESFTGAVGTFSMESFIDKPVTKTNEPVNLKVKISGSGNLKLLDAIKLQLPPDIETYDPKVSDNIAINQKGVNGSRNWEYLLIPRHAGVFKIAPFEFSYYSLESKKYITLKSPEFTLNVNKGNEDAAGPSISGMGKEDIKLLGNDIHYIKTGNVEFLNLNEEFFGSTKFYTLMATPFIFLLGFLIYRKKYASEHADINATKSKKATKIAKKRLALAKKYLTENKNDLVYEEVLKSLYGYVGDKYSIPTSDLSKEKINNLLQSKGKDIIIIEEFLSVIDKCEFARYAPGGYSSSEEVYSKAIKVIEQLELT